MGTPCSTMLHSCLVQVTKRRPILLASSARSAKLSRMACQKTGEILDLKYLQKHYTLHCDILRHTETDKLFFFASRASTYIFRSQRPLLCGPLKCCHCQFSTSRSIRNRNYPTPHKRTFAIHNRHVRPSPPGT